MANESGTWIMYGVSEDDPECIHTVEQAMEYINEIGFLPLFKNEIPGFSLEERTVPEYWWSGDIERDPWEWREIIAGTGRVAYGKFFDKKAGFISKEWFPYFANYRRDGYDFDALWDDEKASMKQKKIMDLFAEENADAELYSFEVIGEQTGRSGGRCSQICKQGLRRLENAQRRSWMIEGYEGRIANLGELASKCSKEFLATGRVEQAALLVQAPEALPGITSNQAKQLMKAGIFNIATLREILNTDFWTWTIPGVGEMGGKRIVYAMLSAGLIDENFEAYKEIRDRNYRQMKFLKLRDLIDEE